MKTFDKFLEGVVALIPQQSARFVVYSILTVGILQIFRFIDGIKK